WFLFFRRELVVVVVVGHGLRRSNLLGRRQPALLQIGNRFCRVRRLPSSQVEQGLPTRHGSSRQSGRRQELATIEVQRFGGNLRGTYVVCFLDQHWTSPRYRYVAAPILDCEIPQRCQKLREDRDLATGSEHFAGPPNDLTLNFVSS